MEKNTTVAQKESQIMVSYAMDNITKAARKALSEYLQEKYLESFAKVVMYLGKDSEESQAFLQEQDDKTRTKILELTQHFHKTDPAVIAETEHIVTAANINLEDNYKVIKKHVPLAGSEFSEDAIHKFRAQTPIFRQKLNSCLFEIENLKYLSNREIQKLLRDIDRNDLVKALEGTSKEVHEKIFNCMSERAAKLLQEDIDFAGPIRQRDVETARAKITEIIFRLEESGDIVIFRYQQDEKLID